MINEIFERQKSKYLMISLLQSDVSSGAKDISGVGGNFCCAEEVWWKTTYKQL
ncbi:MAG: hypothetical protein ACR5KW_02865 [Wolbachia sp.]